MIPLVANGHGDVFGVSIDALWPNGHDQGALGAMLRGVNGFMGNGFNKEGLVAHCARAEHQRGGAKVVLTSHSLGANGWPGDGDTSSAKLLDDAFGGILIGLRDVSLGRGSKGERCEGGGCGEELFHG